MHEFIVPHTEDKHVLLNTSCLYALDRKNYSSVYDHPDMKYFLQLLGYIRTEHETLETTITGMKHILKRMFGANFDIALVDNCGQPKFFGCNVYPPEDKIRKITNHIVFNSVTEVEKLRHIWNSITDWHIDLDSRMFFDSSINLNPGEIAAIIFFNIENTVYNLRIVEKTNRVLREMFSGKGLLLNNLARSSIGSHVFVLPLVNACKFKSYPFEKEGPLFQNGSLFDVCFELKDIYLSAIKKMIVATSLENIDVPITKMDEDISGIAEWIFAAIADMQYSTRMVQDVIKKLLLIEKSTYVRQILANILMGVGDYSREQLMTMESHIPHVQHEFSLNEKAMEFRHNQYLAEAQKKIAAECKKVVQEGLLSLLDSIGNMRKVTQKEIDMIKVQVQKIESVDDKMYILDELHSKLDIVDGSLQLLNSGDKDEIKRVKVSKATLLDQKRQLDEIRNEIVRREIKDPDWNLTVKYPKGYEG